MGKVVTCAVRQNPEEFRNFGQFLKQLEPTSLMVLNNLEALLLMLLSLPMLANFFRPQSQENSFSLSS